MIKRLLKRYQKYIIWGFIGLLILYYYIPALYTYWVMKSYNRRYKAQILHLKARILTIKARREYIETKEGAQKLLEERLKKLRD